MRKPRDDAKGLSAEEKAKEKEDFKASLAGAIKSARKQKGFMQQDLASLADLDLTYIGHLEQKKYIPTSYVLWKIAKALGMSYSELVKDL